MRRIRAILIGGAALAAVTGAVVTAPRVLPLVPGFEVRRVEVSGAALLSPAEVVRAARIRRGQSLWEDAGAWEEALEQHAVIESARVTRRLPGTLRFEVVEKRPVAYLADDVLTLVTASGERLPVDPTRARVDLPIVRGAGEGEVPPVLLSEAERLAAMDAALLAEVSEIRAHDAEGDVLLLRHRKADIVLSTGASAARLVELRAVLADLDRRLGGRGAGEVARVDLRFADQIVVRLPSSVQKP